MMKFEKSLMTYATRTAPMAVLPISPKMKDKTKSFISVCVTFFFVLFSLFKLRFEAGVAGLRNGGTRTVGRSLELDFQHFFPFVLDVMPSSRTFFNFSELMIPFPLFQPLFSSF
jgi:hypothetical protein